MRQLAAAILMVVAAATVCQADEGWKFIGYTADPAQNAQFEVQVASIESMSPTVVRALTRFVREDPRKDRWVFPPAVEAAESLMDFDCTKVRIKNVQETRVGKDGARFVVKKDTIETFQGTSPTSLSGKAREFVCKQEGKLK